MNGDVVGVVTTVVGLTVVGPMKTIKDHSQMSLSLYQLTHHIRSYEAFVTWLHIHRTTAALARVTYNKNYVSKWSTVFTPTTANLHAKQPNGAM
jgi:hypothetical protein